MATEWMMEGVDEDGIVEGGRRSGPLYASRPPPGRPSCGRGGAADLARRPVVDYHLSVVPVFAAIALPRDESDNPGI